MEIVNVEYFYRLTADFELKTYHQSRGMYLFHQSFGRNECLFFVDDVQQPKIACVGHLKSKYGLKMLIIEGECYRTENEFNSKQIAAFYNNICAMGYDIIEVNSSMPYVFEYEFAMRQVGFLRPVGQFSMPISKYISLQNEIKYNQNWKRNIKKSASNSLELKQIESNNKQAFEDFMLIYNKMSDRKALSVNFSSKNIEALCSENDFRLFMVYENNIAIAGIIVHCSNKHAGLLYAATTLRALETSASFFMYNSLFDKLKSDGFTYFDMEKLVPGKTSTHSVFLFKNGIEGQHILLSGEWAYYSKSIYRPLMYFVKKHLFKKREL
jgi:lipid II:glycine glycyltransferase (peptidoglycan interpeptide bridge formation enzyme)